METTSHAPVYSRRNPAPVQRRRGRVTIPKAGKHVQLVFSEMKRQGKIYDEVEVGSGVLRCTVKAWRTKNYPTLNSLEAVLNYLGWDFIPVPRDETITPEVRSALAPAADALGLTMAESLRLLTIIATGVHRPEAQESA